MAPRQCLSCGKPIPPRSGKGGVRKRCETCSPRVERADRKPTLVAIEPRPGGEVFTAALEQLTEAGRESTTLGKMALALAARLDANQDSGGAMASMAKQLEATLESATKGANVVASPMDELRARRAAKHA